MCWPVEIIPITDTLFFRVHKTYVVDGVLKPKVFQERGAGDEKGMSTNWAKYSSAADAQAQGKIPSENGVIEFKVNDLISKGLSVKHKPLPLNRSHTNVNGLPDNLKDLEIRNNLLDIFDWSIRI